MAFHFNYGVVAAAVFGAVFSLFGTFMYVLWPSVLDTILASKLALSPGSSSYGLWEVTPIPMYIEFYLWNWTNPEDIHDPNATIAKPRLVELGPYTFREHRRKVVKGWFDDNSTITFLQNRTWYFEPKMSKGSLDDKITTVNVPAVTAAYALRHASYAYKLMLSLAMGALHTKPHTTKTAREFLFDGYSDPLLNLASIVPKSVVPVQIPFDKFGWFYARNGSATYDGVFNMYTGVSDISKFGELGEWDYTNQTKFYKSYCGQVNGSAGEFFPPFQGKESLSLFVSDICRTLTLNYKEPTEFYGIAGNRYWGDVTTFDNSTEKPDNWCFCTSGECPPSGSIDVSSCKFGAPAFISFPHFYHGDPSYREAVEGMQPNASIHELYIDIEPKSGIPLQVAAALQINILLQPHSEYSFLKEVPKIYFPCVWFRQTAQIDDSIGPMVHMISILPSAGSIVSLVVLSTGLSVMTILAICLITRMCRKEEDAVVLESSQTTIPPSATSRGSYNSVSKIKSMKALLHAYFWRQKVLPSETIIRPQNTGDNNFQNGHNNIHTVAIPPFPLSSSTEYDCKAALVHNTVRSRRSSLISKGEDMAPLYIERDVKSAVAAYM